MLANRIDHNYQDAGTTAGIISSPDSDGGYDVFTGCRHYAPRGSAQIINMEDYTMCDSCSHKRTDGRCGVAEKTLM